MNLCVMFVTYDPLCKPRRPWWHVARTMRKSFVLPASTLVYNTYRIGCCHSFIYMCYNSTMKLHGLAAGVTTVITTALVSMDGIKTFHHMIGMQNIAQFSHFILGNGITKTWFCRLLWNQYSWCHHGGNPSFNRICLI